MSLASVGIARERSQIVRQAAEVRARYPSSACAFGIVAANLAAHAQNAGRRQHALDIELVVRGDAGRIELRESLSISVPMRGDLPPTSRPLEKRRAS